MKCSNCHTPLPDFRWFEKKTCPNCSAPVAQPGPAKVKKDSWEVYKARSDVGRVLWSLLACIGFLTLAILFAMVCAEFWKPAALLMFLFFVCAVGAALVFVVYLLRTIFMFKATGSFGSALLRTVIFGAIALITAVVIMVGINTKHHYHETKDQFVQVEAQISRIKITEDDDGDEHYKVYISFTYDGKEYEDIRYGKYSSAMHEGDKLTVTIDPTKPERLPDNGTLPIVLGSIFFTIASSLLCFTVIIPLSKGKIA